MKLTGGEFLNQKRKAITLMGMSGVGKTHFGRQLKRWGWDYYSCDYEIGINHLNIPVTVEDLTKMSTYIGKLGDPRKGGLELVEFKKRQHTYYNAECAAVENVGALLVESSGNFVHDSTGSLCEIEDEELIARLGERTLIVYIKSDEAHNKKVLERAKTHPKPLFFPSQKFDEWLEEYIKEKGLSGPEQIDPDDFSRHLFPRLFEARLPKYQRIADRHGVTIPVVQWSGIETEKDFVNLVAEALG